jgi:hypothetical protein
MPFDLCLAIHFEIADRDLRQERRGGRGSAVRGDEPALDAFCGAEDCRTTSGTDAGVFARSSGSFKDTANERYSRACCRIRRDRRFAGSIKLICF